MPGHTDLVQALISQPSKPLSHSLRSIERIQILWQEDQGSESTFPTIASRPSPETNLLAGKSLHFAPAIAFKENPSPAPSPSDTIFSAGHWQSVFLERASDGSVLDGLEHKDTRGRRLCYYNTIGDICGEPEIVNEEKRMHFKDVERTWGWIGFLYNSIWGMGGQSEGLFIHNSFTQREESAIYWTDAFEKMFEVTYQQKV